MYLPEQVQLCINTLEQAGYQAYAVGGCVRDALLGQTPQDYDLCTNATPDELQRIFSDYSLVLSGIKHGTVGVIIDHTLYEITTFRTEGGYADNRHPDWVRFVEDVTQDLARRDFTVNAMAYNPSQGYIDPFGGQQDLQNGILRAVGDPMLRFQEDALRILRGVRFSVRFNLTPHPDTLRGMFALKDSMEQLARERVFEELSKLLPQINAQQLIQFAPIITAVIPELAPCVDFQQHSVHHIHDVYTHTAYVTQRVAPTQVLRWAALLHDIGKPPSFFLDQEGEGHFHGHASVSAEMADQVLLRLKSPTALREQVVKLIKLHMNPLQPDKKLLTRQLSKHGWETVENLLELLKADYGAHQPDYTQVEDLLEQLRQEDACLSIRDLAVNGRDMMALGIGAGPKMGQLLQTILTLVQEQKLPNEKAAITDYIKKTLGL